MNVLMEPEAYIADRQRSALMARVRRANTTPELAVRRSAHRLGYRFRLHRKDLPGTPDIVFPKARKAIFVHGCFWHRHAGCRAASMPKTRSEFWQEKFITNIRRDLQKEAELENLGWQSLIIWECQTRDAIALRNILSEFLAQ